MVHKQVSSNQIYALQVVFTLAYVTGVVLVVGFIAGAFILASWVLNLMVIDLSIALSTTIDPHMVSSVVAFILIAIPLFKGYRKFKATLTKYWLMIVNIKTGELPTVD